VVDARRADRVRQYTVVSAHAGVIGRVAARPARIAGHAGRRGREVERDVGHAVEEARAAAGRVVAAEASRSPGVTGRETGEVPGELLARDSGVVGVEAG